MRLSGAGLAGRPPHVVGSKLIDQREHAAVTRRFVTAALMLFLGFALSGVAGARSLQQVLNDGTLRVGVALFTPWAMRAPGGDLIGFEVDVANRLAEDMGLRVDIRVYPFERLVTALEGGEIDIVAAGLVVTPERALHVNFSQPYATGGITLATHVDSTAALERLEDLDSNGFKVAALAGSTAAELASRVLPRAELVLFEDTERAGAALVNGDVEAYLEELPIPTFLALEHPGVVDVPVTQPLLRTPLAFAVNKGDPDFLAFLNAWITAREADTWLPSTHAYWFESLRWRRLLEER
jgi:polar amino acid transport system substrate-binding protein